MKAQQGTWTLTAPDGRTWKADSPLRCVATEINERVPPEVRLERITQALLEDGPQDWRLQAAIWLREQANEQEKTNAQYPQHAAAYKRWRDLPFTYRQLAERVTTNTHAEQSK